MILTDKPQVLDSLHSYAFRHSRSFKRVLHSEALDPGLCLMIFCLVCHSRELYLVRPSEYHSEDKGLSTLLCALWSIQWNILCLASALLSYRINSAGNLWLIAATTVDGNGGKVPTLSTARGFLLPTRFSAAQEDTTFLSCLCYLAEALLICPKPFLPQILVAALISGPPFCSILQDTSTLVPLAFVAY